MDDSGKPTDEEFFTHKPDFEETADDDLAVAGDDQVEEEEEAVDEETEEPSKRSLLEQIKQLPRPWKIGGAAGTAVVVLGLLAWFVFLGGDDGKRPKRRPTPGPAAAQRSQPQPARHAEQPPEEQPAGDGEEPGTAQPEPEEPPEEELPPEEEPPKRPEDFDEWTLPDDYLAARAEGDPRLAQAVAHLAEASPDPEPAKVLDTLERLLAPPEPSEEEAEERGAEPGRRPAGRAPARPGKSRGDSQVVDAVVRALVTINTEESRDVLRRLLAGEVVCEDEATAVETVFDTLADALAAQPNLYHELILFHALTRAEEFRPPERGAVTAEELREKAYAVLEPIASEQCRRALAEYFVQPTTARQWREKYGEMLLADRPENIRAQELLYRWEETDAETRETLEQYFLTRSAAAMAFVLKIPGDAAAGTAGRRPGVRRPPARRSGTTADTPDPAIVHGRMAKVLWGKEFAERVIQRLSKLESLEENAQFVTLAATIPADAVRRAVYETLEDNWDQGPEDLASAGLIDKLVTDPGLVLTLKALPRAEERQVSG